MIKQLLGCRHLLSTKHGGVEIQMYLAIIACLLILIYTGRQPTKRTYEMICFYLLGWADLGELEVHLSKLKSAVPLGTLRTDQSFTGFGIRRCADDRHVLGLYKADALEPACR